MSPVSRSKSKDKKGSKETGKGSSKGSSSSSGYNPLLGTFHTIETAPSSSSTGLHVIGRFRNIDDTDDHNNGLGTEYDSVSNNDSWSGESEAAPPRHEVAAPPPPVIVPGADNEKREKIRQKNERKHQRQKERRAQELHERCSGYLMSRKLEALAQQLVSMGFSQERATMALILNEGRVEESVAWLFEGGEEIDKSKEHNNNNNNLKIEISEELARIADMEVKHKCSKQDVERAIVACEGDLDKAEETLRTQKQEPLSIPPKLEETNDPVKILPPPQSKTTLKRDEKDFNYTKTVDLKKRIQPKTTEWSNNNKPQIQTQTMGEKRWSSNVSVGNPSVTSSSSSPLQIQQGSTQVAMTENRYLVMGNEMKNLQLGSIREPVIVMQRPQSVNVTKQTQTPQVLSQSQPPPPPPPPPPSSSPPGWYPSSINGGDTNTMKTNQMYNNQVNYQTKQFVSSNSVSSSSSTVEGNRSNNGLWNRNRVLQPTLAPASSLGLFSGLGNSNGGSSSFSNVDWSSGSSLLQFDYTNIDWSVDRGGSGSSMSSRPGSGSGGNGNGWSGMNSYMNNNNNNVVNRTSYDSFNSRNTMMRPVVVTSGGGGGNVAAGLQEGGGETSGSREWTSPFEEKDLFSLPRQFVSSPSL